MNEYAGNHEKSIIDSSRQKKSEIYQVYAGGTFSTSLSCKL